MRRWGLAPEGQAGRQASEWTAYGGSDRGDRYAPADLITGQCRQAEEGLGVHTGDLPGEGDPGEITYQVTPLKVGDNLFICTPHSIAIAVDADTGEERWRFDPSINRDAEYYQHMTCRGLAYHDATAYSQAPASAAEPAARCERRLFLPTNDGTLIALDVADGKPARTSVMPARWTSRPGWARARWASTCRLRRPW